jgi:hypothetical protein
MTISSTDIAIDGTTAWLVVDEANQIGFTHYGRPCDTCKGYGQEATAHDGTVAGGYVDCPDCGGTGRHTFTLDVREPCRSEVDCWNDIKTFTVHVVEVLPIVDATAPQQTVRADIIDWGEKHHRNSPTRFVYMPADQTTAGTYLPAFPTSAAPGKYAVRLAIHESETP